MKIATNLIDQFFMRMESCGIHAYVIWVVDLAEQADEAALRQSLAAAVSEVPRLCCRIEVRPFTCALVPYDPPGPFLDGLLEAAAPGETLNDVLARLESPDDPTRPPIRAYLIEDAPDAAGSRLLVTARHSSTDGIGLQFFIERWGEHYRRLVDPGAPAPAALPAPAPMGPPWLMRRLDRRRRMKCWLAATRAFRLILNVFWPRPSVEVATFLDQPLPCGGVLQHIRTMIDYGAYRRVMYWAVEQKTSLADAILVAVYEAGRRMWPGQEHLPIVIDVPVSLRDEGDRDPANRVASNNVVFPPDLADDRDRIIKCASDGSREVRKGMASLSEIMEKFPFSFMPTKWTAELIRRHFRKRKNTYDTITFAALEPFRPRLTSFGGIAVENAYMFGSLYAPPGVRLTLSPAAKGVNLTLAFLNPAMSFETAEKFLALIVERLRSVVGATDKEAAAPSE